MQVLTDQMSRATGLTANDTVLMTSWTSPHKWLGKSLGGELGAQKSGVWAMNSYIADLHRQGLPINAENINHLLKIDYTKKMRNNGFIKYDYEGNRIPLERSVEETGKRGPKPYNYEAYADTDGVWKWDTETKRKTGENVRYLSLIHI